MKKQLRIGIYILLATLLASVAVAQEPTTPALRSGQKGEITFTTAKAVEEKISLKMTYTGDAPTLSGATGTPESGKWITYTLTSQNVTITGDVTDLDCSNNPGNQLTALDVSKNTALTTLSCSYNQLTALDVSQNTALTSLYCGNNQLTALDVSQNTALTELYCFENQLTALDVSKNTALTTLSCSRNQLKALDVSKNTALTSLLCGMNQLTALDVSQNTSLTWLFCSGNQIKGEEMTRLVNSLPNRTGKNASTFFVVQEPDLEGNICLKSDVAIAKGKNWDTRKYKSDTNQSIPYEGAEDAHPLKVTLTKEGEGTITATGATDLNAVPLGTELTIVATPAASYELKALTANGTDILATKKFTVTAATEVKATFTKKTYAVTLTKEGEGTITATGATDLNAVPLGTELTIEATPAAGYELTALTANGTDILATKKFVVTAATEVKATFTKKTYAVTLTKEGEGTITATGASNLNTVAYGTELTINATPATGYELTALTANGTDILATKKVIVKEAVEVKATFTKKSFAVSLTKEGEGTITATGASNLNSVAYGTELTIVATPADGYELKALTANGTDILASKKVIVKEAVEVKATFTKKSFAVSLTKEGEGTITATGASDLNSVAYGTELTIVATPAAGYELVSLDANGVDITATKKVVVIGDLTVKATFTKKVQPKTYKVTLKPTEHGTITIKEDVDLNAVPEGTKLTVVPKGANDKCELTKLTANGEDILKDMTFTVTEDTEVVAEFVDHTGIDAVAANAFVIYPNPASESATVTGLAPEAAVALYTLDGQLITRLAADRSGRLQIDLTALSDGTYLVVTEGAAQRLVVKH